MKYFYFFLSLNSIVILFVCYSNCMASMAIDGTFYKRISIEDTNHNLNCENENVEGRDEFETTWKIREEHSRLRAKGEEISLRYWTPFTTWWR